MEAKRPVEFGTTGWCPALQGASIARDSEELGFDVQGFGENHSSSPDVFGEVRDGLRATTRIRFLCGPVNFVTRDPGVIASSVAPLHLLGPGRVLCGIARGDSAVAVAGRGPQRQQALERDLAMLRAYLDRREVRFPTWSSRLEWIGELPYQPVPVEMVCSGPKSIALAARLADRIGLSVGCNRERIGWALRIVDEGLVEAGRSRADVRVGTFVPLAVTADRVSGRRAIRSRVAGWAHMSSFRGNDLSQQPEIMRRVTTSLREAYDYRSHGLDAPADNPYNAATDEEFADWFGVGGPPSYIVERLGELVELGLDYFTSVLPAAERERFAAEAMPDLRAIRS
jgi:alkanesulfonate monooxygenase SsuD/methylene tetrahydromethanopterin reductase-like flavin-dependent oxidoreductase (luciferase family)